MITQNEMKNILLTEIPLSAVGEGIKDEYLVIRYPLSDIDEEDMRALTEIVGRIEAKKGVII